MTQGEGGSGDAKTSLAEENGSGAGPAVESAGLRVESAGVRAESAGPGADSVGVKAESAGLRTQSAGDRASPNKRRRLEGPEASVPEANGRPEVNGESRREVGGGGAETAGEADPQEVTAHAVEQILEPSFVMMDVHIPPMVSFGVMKNSWCFSLFDGSFFFLVFRKPKLTKTPRGLS